MYGKKWYSGSVGVDKGEGGENKEEEENYDNEDENDDDDELAPRKSMRSNISQKLKLNIIKTGRNFDDATSRSFDAVASHLGKSDPVRKRGVIVNTIGEDETPEVEKFLDADLIPSKDTDNQRLSGNNNNNSNNSSNTNTSGTREDNNNKRPSKDDQSVSFGSGRMVGSRVYFDDVYDKIQDNDREHVRAQEPPYVPRMNDSELDATMQHELARLKSKEAILKDEYMIFIDTVAGLAFMSRDQLLNSPSGRDSGPGAGSVLYGMKSVPQGTTLSPVGAPGNPLLSPVPSPPRSPDPQGGAPTGIPPNVASGGPVNIITLLRDKEFGPQAQDWIRRERIYNNLKWIERPDVLGVLDVNPILTGAMNYTISVIKSRGNPDFNASTLHDFIVNPDIRPIFAAAVAERINISKTTSPIQHLERDSQRAWKAFNGAVSHIVNTYAFSETEQTFTEKNTSQFYNSSELLYVPQMADFRYQYKPTFMGGQW
jgi:hypothetical protein